MSLDNESEFPGLWQKFSSLVALKGVKIKIFSAAFDDNFIELMTFPFMCKGIKTPLYDLNSMMWTPINSGIDTPASYNTITLVSVSVCLISISAKYDLLYQNGAQKFKWRVSHIIWTNILSRGREFYNKHVVYHNLYELGRCKVFNTFQNNITLRWIYIYTVKPLI